MQSEVRAARVKFCPEGQSDGYIVSLSAIPLSTLTIFAQIKMLTQWKSEICLAAGEIRPRGRVKSSPLSGQR